MHHLITVYACSLITSRASVVAYADSDNWEVRTAVPTGMPVQSASRRSDCTQQRGAIIPTRSRPSEREISRLGPRTCGFTRASLPWAEKAVKGTRHIGVVI